MKALVIIPTYNESDNIKKAIQLVFKSAKNIDVLVVDDNSPDKTANVVKAIMKKDKRVNLIERKAKKGLGTAYIAGFKFALKRNYDRILEMDADLSHDPSEIPNFLKASEEADVVIGSRYLNGVNVVHWPLRRLILSYGANIYSRVITGMPLHDTTSGFKCFRREVLEAVDLDAVHSGGYSFQIEMNFRAWCKGFRLKEIPIIFVDRTLGQSKMNFSIMVEAAKVVWKLKYQQLSGKLE
ncbi:MAG: polyprenol monophosphomannose synthase [Candidatus Marinimicrobia bacterium]|nr:polyprenol monophosphomannose synthase [Candidatus Neomarinimicrobiota bacterium]TFB10643.1 polyprenol monophosphomannose synthase [Candidatus Marinimicrobia bacterium MT.SAG.2]